MHQAGAYDRPLDVLVKDVIQKDDGTGQERVVDWPVWATVYGRRIVQTGFAAAMERFTAQQMEARVTVRYELAHPIEGLAHDMRLYDHEDQQSYDINGIEPSHIRGAGPVVACTVHAE